MVNRTRTLPHGISGVTVLVNQHIAKNCLIYVQFYSFKDSILEKRTNNLEAFTSIQQNTNDLLAVSRISSTIFQKVRMATFVHSFNEDSSFVEMATPETPCGKVPVLFTTWHLWVSVQ